MKIHVLIVDDNKDIRYTIRETLISVNKNYEFTEACDGKDCLNKLKKIKPDVVLMDIMMPVMDGTEAAVKIRENKQTRNIPIIFLTAKTDRMTRSMGSIVGTDFVEKPFEPTDLDERIRAALEKTPDKS